MKTFAEWVERTNLLRKVPLPVTSWSYEFDISILLGMADTSVVGKWEIVRFSEICNELQVVPVFPPFVDVRPVNILSSGSPVNTKTILIDGHGRIPCLRRDDIERILRSIDMGRDVYLTVEQKNGIRVPVIVESFRRDGKIFFNTLIEDLHAVRAVTADIFVDVIAVTVNANLLEKKVDITPLSLASSGLTPLQYENIVWSDMGRHDLPAFEFDGPPLSEIPITGKTPNFSLLDSVCHVARKIRNGNRFAVVVSHDSPFVFEVVTAEDTRKEGSVRELSLRLADRIGNRFGFAYIVHDLRSFIENPQNMKLYVEEIGTRRTYASLVYHIVNRLSGKESRTDEGK